VTVAGLDRYGDPLPAGALARLGTVRFKHSNHTQGLAYSPDGSVLASAGGWRGVCLWDAASGRLLHELERSGGVISVAFSRDGEHLVGAGAGSSLGLWDVTGGKEVWRVPAPDAAHSVALSADGRTVISGGFDRLVHVWDAATGAERRQLRGHDSNILTVACSPDGKYIAAAGRSKVICIWDAASGARHTVLTGRLGEVSRVAFSPDGKRLASGGLDGTVRIWDIDAAKQVTRFGEALDWVNALAWCPDGRVLASGHTDGRIRLWDTGSGKENHCLRAHAFRATALAFSPDGKTLASGALLHGALRLWDVQTGRERRPLAGPRGVVAWLAFAADSHSLFLACWDQAHARPSDGAFRNPVFLASSEQTLLRWDWARDAEEPLLRWHAPSVFGAQALTPDGPIALGCDAQDDKVQVWGPGSRRPPRPLEGRLEQTRAVAFSPDGRRLACGGEDRSILLWDVEAGRRVRTIDGLDSEVAALAFSPDGTTFVSGHYSHWAGVPGLPEGRGLRLWNTATGKQLRSLACPEAVRQAAFSPDGRLLACACARGSGPLQPRVWDLATGEELPLPALVKNCWSLAFSPDDKLLVVGDFAAPECALVELNSGQEVRRFQGHSSWVAAVAFSGDGKLLATGGGDGNVVLWDLTGRQAPGSRRTAVDADRCWRELARADAPRAYAAVWGLAAVPAVSVPLLRQRLRPLPVPDEAGQRRLRRWVADLDGEDFSTRQRAAEELEKLAEVAAPVLRAALKDRPAPEARRQIERLLAALSAWTGERLRVSRAVAVLEQIATPEARRLLEDLAAGAPEALPTREAKAALERLARRHAEP
jgi:WD40 repeat protein